MKTQTEVIDEVAALKAIKPNVPQLTLFGDNNWTAIDFQIEVLVDNWEDQDVYDALDEGEINEHEQNAALEAITWRDGYYDEYEKGGEIIDRPSLSWKHWYGRKLGEYAIGNWACTYNYDGGGKPKNVVAMEWIEG